MQVTDQVESVPSTTINGTNRCDTLNGTAGVDIIFGKNGADTINGLGGDDVLFGGKGSDLFSFTGIFGDDTISDFKRSEGDRIQFNQSTFADFNAVMAAATQVDTDVLITTAQGDSVLIENLSLQQINADYFFFG